VDVFWRFSADFTFEICFDAPTTLAGGIVGDCLVSRFFCDFDIFGEFLVFPPIFTDFTFLKRYFCGKDIFCRRATIRRVRRSADFSNKLVFWGEKVAGSRTKRRSADFSKKKCF